MATLIEMAQCWRGLIDNGEYDDADQLQNEISNRLLAVVEEELNLCDYDEERSRILEREFGLFPDVEPDIDDSYSDGKDFDDNTPEHSGYGGNYDPNDPYANLDAYLDTH